MNKTTAYRCALLTALCCAVQAVCAVALAQGRGHLEDEHWENIPEYPYTLNGEHRRVIVHAVEVKRGDTLSYPVYDYTVNEHGEPKRLQLHDLDNGQYIADYTYSYAIGETVNIVKEENGLIQYSQRLEYGQLKEETKYKNGEPKYIWRYNSNGKTSYTIAKEKTNGKTIYTWYTDMDDQGRMLRSYRKNRRKITQLLAHAYDDEAYTVKVYHLDNKALYSLEIGLNVDRDSLVRMDPRIIASAYTRPVVVQIYQYDENDALRRYTIKTQMGMNLVDHEYSYNEEGLLLDKKTSLWGGTSQLERYAYDENNLRSSSTINSQYPDRNENKIHRFFYDESNNLTKIEVTDAARPEYHFVLHFQYSD